MTAPVWRRVGVWCARLLLSAVFGLVAAAVVILIVIPQAVHGQALTVLSGSMTPGLPVGSLLVNRPVDAGTLRVGDVATYQKEPGKPEFITHRIVAVDATTDPVTFTFKGDANRGADTEPVPAGAIRGQMWFHVPYLGAVRDAMHTGGGLATLGMLLLAGYAVQQIYGAVRDRRRKPPTATARRDTGRAATGSDEAVIMASFRPAALHGLEPATLASALHAVLLPSQDRGDTCTLLLRVPRSRIGDTAALLDVFAPVALDVSPPPETSGAEAVDLAASRPEALDA